MKTKNPLVMIVWIGLLSALLAPSLLAQSNPLFVQLKNNVLGALYKPDSGPAARVGIVVMHREANQMSNIACTEFSKRGFLVLCMNSRFYNNESSVQWEQIPLDVGQGVDYLKKVQRMTKVFLYGNSGGGVTMSFYQAVAENGPSVCQGENKLVECGDDLAGLTPADGIILVDGHPGNPILRLRSINGSIINDFGHSQVDPALDPFSARNGFNPKGASKYSEEFKKKYFEAQAKRMNIMIEAAQQKLEEMRTGDEFFSDDAPFTIMGFDGARLQSLDLTIRHSTVRPEKLLKNDGTIVTEIVSSIAPPRPELVKTFSSFREGARGGLTVKSFLSSNAIRATNSMDEQQIDLCSTNNSTPCMLQHVKAPLLAAAMQASFQNLLVEIESNYLYATTKDKDFIVLEGATTGVTPCENCGGDPGQYSNATKNFFDYAAKWINGRM